MTPSTCATCGGTGDVRKIPHPPDVAWNRADMGCPDCTGKAAPSGAVSEERLAMVERYATCALPDSMIPQRVARYAWEIIQQLQQRRPTEEMQRALLAGRAALLREEDDFREEYTAHRNAVSKERADECAAHAATLEAIAGKL